MRYNLKGTGLDISDEIRAYIEKKLAVFDKMLTNQDGARADVEVEYLKTEERTYRAEFMLHDGMLLRSEARGQSLHEAIDKAHEELRLELTREKKKSLRLMRRGALRAKEFLLGWRNNI